ncbi:hypothetical protein V492_05176 [Pseudogymnoascus sp. VKM F-4246]|nr:hypothetical protein V492_05176 [Pseudogymnoascus sp. VKM F-4246]
MSFNGLDIKSWGNRPNGVTGLSAHPTKIQDRNTTPNLTTNTTTMVEKRSVKAQELNLRLSEAILGVQSGKFKTAYAAAKALGLRAETVRSRMRGTPTRSEARQKQQHLSKNQEIILLKWIKTGYMARPATPPKSRPDHPSTTMVKRKSIKAQERNLRLSEAVLGVQTGKFKSANAAAIALDLRPDTVRRRVRGIQHTQADAQLTDYKP